MKICLYHSHLTKKGTLCISFCEGERGGKGELEQLFGVDEDDEFLSLFIERKLYIF